MKAKSLSELKRRLKLGYWICFECAEDNGAKSDGGAHTCSTQKCSICAEDKTCNAITDWHWPNGLAPYIWD